MRLPARLVAALRAVPTWVRWLAVAGVGGLILYFSLVASPPSPPVDQAALDRVWDKVLHAGTYAALSVSLWFALLPRPLAPGVRAVGVFLAAVTYGGAIEGLQWLVDDRYSSWLDLFADVLGAAVVLQLARWEGGLGHEPVEDRG